MRSFLSPSPSSPSASSPAGRSRALAGPGRAFWHRQSGAVGVFGGTAVSDAEAAQRALLCRSEAFAEDLGPGYDGLRFVGNAIAAR